MESTLQVTYYPNDDEMLKPLSVKRKVNKIIRKLCGDDVKIVWMRD
jgi:hypothetical protein